MSFYFIRNVAVLAALSSFLVFSGSAYAQINAPNGAVIMGTDARNCGDGTGGTAYEGSIRFNDSSDGLEFCDGTSWISIDGGGSSLWSAMATGDNIYFNSGTGKVGIGTTSPGYPLHVKGTGVSMLALDRTSSPNVDNIFYLGPSWGTQTAIDQLRIGTGITTIAAFSSGGNVGIGTTDPRSKLDVQGGIKIGADASSCTATNEGTQRYNTTSNVMEYCDGSDWIALSTGGGGLPSGAIDWSDCEAKQATYYDNSTNTYSQTCSSGKVLVAYNCNMGAGSPGYVPSCQCYVNPANVNQVTVSVGSSNTCRVTASLKCCKLVP